MRSPGRLGWRLVVYSLTGLMWCAPAAARLHSGPESAMDGLDRWLELQRHERLAARKSDADSRLTAFSSDGCSGGLSLVWEKVASVFPGFRERHGGRPPWESCCIAHDRLYHTAGGRYISVNASVEARLSADIQLRSCVLRTGLARMPALVMEYGVSPAQVERLYEAIARLMYRAVRLGGLPCTGLSWRWGYGWPECH